MAITEQGKIDLRWCADQALLEFDIDPQSGIDAFLSDMQRRETTSKIDPMIAVVALSTAARKGRDAFEQAILDFRV